MSEPTKYELAVNAMLKERIEELERERNELRKLILDFCEGENWTIQRWQDQEHVKPLFNMAEKIKTNQELTNDKLV